MVKRTIYLSDELYKLTDSRAKQEGRSFANMVTKILSDVLESPTETVDVKKSTTSTVENGILPHNLPLQLPLLSTEAPDPQLVNNITNIKETKSVQRNLLPKEKPLSAALFSERINDLRQVYGEEYQEKIDEVFEGWKSCRSSYKIANSVLLKELEYWSKFPFWIVRDSIDTYVEKECWKDGSKSENYFRGILRNTDRAWEKEAGGDG